MGWQTLSYFCVRIILDKSLPLSFSQKCIYSDVSPEDTILPMQTSVLKISRCPRIKSNLINWKTQRTSFVLWLNFLFEVLFRYVFSSHCPVNWAIFNLTTWKFPYGLRSCTIEDFLRALWMIAGCGFNMI